MKEEKGGRNEGGKGGLETAVKKICHLFIFALKVGLFNMEKYKFGERR